MAAGRRSARPAADADTEEVGQRELRGAGMPCQWIMFAAKLAPIGRAPAGMLTTGRCRYHCLGPWHQRGCEHGHSPNADLLPYVCSSRYQ